MNGLKKETGAQLRELGSDKGEALRALEGAKQAAEHRQHQLQAITGQVPCKRPAFLPFSTQGKGAEHSHTHFALLTLALLLSFFCTYCQEVGATLAGLSPLVLALACKGFLNDLTPAAGSRERCNSASCYSEGCWCMGAG